MAINQLEYSKLMMKQLDQHAVQNLTSGWMEQNAGQVIYHGGDEVKIPTMSTSGLGKYDRDKGFAEGSVSVKYETYKMTQDRGRTFQLDAMDVDESGFVATSANVIKVFQEEQVIPEIDSYRYSKIAAIAKKAGQTEAVSLTADNALNKILEHIRAVQDVVGDDVPLVLTMSSMTRALIEDSPKISRYLNVVDFTQGKMSFKVKALDESPMRIAPSSRLKTKYDILDGTTSGQEQGGLKAASDAKDIHWIICPMSVPIAISKTDKLRLFDPDKNQKADAWKIDYRKYHDLWIKKQKEKEIFVCMSV